MSHCTISRRQHACRHERFLIRAKRGFRGRRHNYPSFTPNDFEASARRAANNVANVETTGFRAQQFSFQEYLKPEKGNEIGVKPDRPLSLVDAAYTFTTTSARRSGLQSSGYRGHPDMGNPLDLAINGNAYFVVQTPQGERYTRDGSFCLNGTGRLVTMDRF